VSVDGLEFVAGKAEDGDRISDIVLGVPGTLTTDVSMKALGIGNFEKARRLWRLVNSRAETWRKTVLARSAGETVGVLVTEPIELAPAPRLLLEALRLLGPVWLLRLPRRFRTEVRVHTGAPGGAFRISELHVAAEHRGRGIGSALLVEAERRARADERPLMSLEVLTANPALRLYERFGFEIALTATDPAFERVTGVSGNHRMNKVLT